MVIEKPVTLPCSNTIPNVAKIQRLAKKMQRVAGSIPTWATLALWRMVCAGQIAELQRNRQHHPTDPAPRRVFSLVAWIRIDEICLLFAYWNATKVSLR